MAPTFTPDRVLFRQVVAEIAEKAKETLPEANGRVDKAVALVLNGDVELLADGTARIYSQSNGITSYHVVNGVCECPDYARAPSSWCKHRIAHSIQKRAEARLSQPDDQHGAPVEMAPSPARPRQTIPAKYIQKLQGKDFVRYTGLLQAAQADGLVELSAIWTANTDELSTAHAVAIFADGRRYEESGDSSPQNARNIGLHWRRMSLTRAKARALRDALGVEECSVEEME